MFPSLPPLPKPIVNYIFSFAGLQSCCLSERVSKNWKNHLRPINKENRLVSLRNKLMVWIEKSQLNQLISSRHIELLNSALEEFDLSMDQPCKNADLIAETFAANLIKCFFQENEKELSFEETIHLSNAEAVICDPLVFLEFGFFDAAALLAVKLEKHDRESRAERVACHHFRKKREELGFQVLLASSHPKRLEALQSLVDGNPGALVRFVAQNPQLLQEAKGYLNAVQAYRLNEQDLSLFNQLSSQPQLADHQKRELEKRKESCLLC